jgi:hypothetical protein
MHVIARQNKPPVGPSHRPRRVHAEPAPPPTRARRGSEDALSLATAKLNQVERFGVGLGETYGLNSGDDLPPERVYLELEEHYHTRLLADVLDIFGLPFQVVAPPFVMRQFVKIGVFLPERLGFPFGHVGAARCTPTERALMRWLYPRFARLFARQTLEISLLTHREKLHGRLNRPFDVEELIAGLSNETFLAAHP